MSSRIGKIQRELIGVILSHNKSFISLFSCIPSNMIWHCKLREFSMKRIVDFMVNKTRLDIIQQNTRHWRKYKNELSNYYLQHNANTLTLNSRRLKTNNNEYLKVYTYSNLTSGTRNHAGNAILVKSNINKHILNLQ